MKVVKVGKEINPDLKIVISFNVTLINIILEILQIFLPLGKGETL